MNRNEEYMDLMNELDEQAPSSLSGSVAKAKKKRMRRQVAWRSVSTVAVVCAMFVLLVNVSEPVAQAASKVPILSDLVKAVRRSDSLTKAVEKEYVQPVGLTETKNGITAEISYIIADESQVNVFYKVTSDTYKDMRFHMRAIGGGSYNGSGSYGKDEGDLNRCEFNFGKGTPDNMTFELLVFDRNSKASLAEENSIAKFEFDIEIDKENMGKYKLYTVDKEVKLGEYNVKIQSVEVYQTHMKIRLDYNFGDINRIGKLEFYVNADNGMKFSYGSDGYHYSTSSKTGRVYYGESSYFYDTELTELVITGAECTPEQRRSPIVNLDTGECYYLPDGVEMVSLEQKDNAWIVSFKAKHGENWSDYNLFTMGVRYKNNSGRFDDRVVTDCGDGYFIETLTIYDWPHGELMMDLNMKYTWTPDKEIVIPLQ